MRLRLHVPACSMIMSYALSNACALGDALLRPGQIYITAGPCWLALKCSSSLYPCHFQRLSTLQPYKQDLANDHAWVMHPAREILVLFPSMESVPCHSLRKCIQVVMNIINTEVHY